MSTSMLFDGLLETDNFMCQKMMRLVTSQRFQSVTYINVGFYWCIQSLSAKWWTSLEPLAKAANKLGI